MPSMPAHKYRAFHPIDLDDRRWPGRRIEQAPTWCSVDLRDGNQALALPMGPDRKQVLYELLLEIGFREIEVGFPSASETDYAFLRQVIEAGVPLCDAGLCLVPEAVEEAGGSACVGVPSAVSIAVRRTPELAPLRPCEGLARPAL